jgi:hypothetical protein
MSHPLPSQARRHFCLIVSVIVLLFAGNLGCQHSNVSRIRIKLEDLPQDKATVPAKPVQPPPVCPSTGVVPLQLGAPRTGHHRVTLTWKASAHSNNSESDAYGYCLYRSQPEGRSQIKKKADCPKCEQVNRVPVPSTGCIDDVVADGAQYYYVVAAVNSKGTLSSPSNEIPVSIPSARSVKPAPPSQLPLCRVGLQPQAH